jgi:hypothetical protein
MREGATTCGGEEKAMGTLRRMSAWVGSGALRGPGHRLVACATCGTGCAVPVRADLGRVGCIACLRPFESSPSAAALTSVADWWEKSRVPGPGYALVDCPRCATECVVPVGVALEETGCIGCLAPLGPGPLVRRELPASRMPPAPPRAPSWAAAPVVRSRVILDAVRGW